MRPNDRRTRGAIALVALLAAAGCSEKTESRIGKDAANIVSDTNVMEEAEAAANAVIRNAADCDAVKATLPEADHKLADAEKKIRTQAGIVALQTLKTQVQRVRELCP